MKGEELATAEAVSIVVTPNGPPGTLQLFISLALPISLMNMQI